MRLFDDHSGPWRGSNGFRLVPTNPMAEAPATATLTGVRGAAMLMQLQRA